MARKVINTLFYILLFVFAAAFIFPVAVVMINSFKAKFSISTSPFTLPFGNDFVGLSNYTGVLKTRDFSQPSVGLCLLPFFRLPQF